MMSLFTRSIMIVMILIIIWQGILFITDLPPYILPSPWQVMLTLIEQKNLLAMQTLPTLFETLMGFLLGLLFGCLAGAIVTLCQPIKSWVFPLLLISQAVPTFAIAPLLVIWLGYGLASKIVTAMLMIFFPMMSAFYDGLKQTPTAWLELAETMRAEKWRIFWYIRLPASLKTLSAGIRIAAISAPIGAMIGEWVGSSQGLGYLMLNANARMQIDLMFAALIIVIIMALSLYLIVDKLLRTFIWWN